MSILKRLLTEDIPLIRKRPPRATLRRKLPLPVHSDNWTFLAGYFAGGPNEAVTVHGIADRDDSQRGSGGHGRRADHAGPRDRRGTRARLTEAFTLCHHAGAASERISNPRDQVLHAAEKSEAQQ
jgi:hypothetical protein